MSEKLSGQVWEMRLPPNEKLVLLALADQADHNGNNAYPGEELLAAKTGYDKRNVRRLLRALEGRGIIVRTHQGHGPNNFDGYSILPSTAAYPSPCPAANAGSLCAFRFPLAPRLAPQEGAL